ASLRSAADHDGSAQLVVERLAARIDQRQGEPGQPEGGGRYGERRARQRLPDCEGPAALRLDAQAGEGEAGSAPAERGEEPGIGDREKGTHCAPQRRESRAAEQEVQPVVSGTRWPRQERG